MARHLKPAHGAFLKFQPALALPPPPDWGRHALFLDFDGTLAPIVDRPEDARMSEKAHDAVERIGRFSDGAVAILTGRALQDLDRIARLDAVPAAGSHGVEFRKAGGRVEMDGHGREMLTAYAERLRAFANRHGLLVEQKPGAVTLHYRSDPGCEDASRDLINDLAASDDALRAMHGDMVSELALRGTDKGTALLKFMRCAPFAGRIPIMAGDDVTDEDAIRAAEENGGFGIKIGMASSAARFRAATIEDFLDWLDRVSRPQAT